MKDPAFLFYSKDWLSGCQFMDMAERGVYITLLAAQHQNGRLDPKRVGFLLGFGWDMVSDIVKSKFETDDDGFVFNVRLEEEIQKRAQHSEKQRENGKKGGRPRQNKNPNETQTESQTEPKKKPLGNVNENVNVNENNGVENFEKNFPHYTTRIEEEQAEPQQVNHAEFFEQSIEDELWLEGVMRYAGLDSIKKVQSYMTTYYEMLNVIGKQHPTLKKYREHFANWTKLEVFKGSKPTVPYEL